MAAQSSIFPACRSCSASPGLPHQQGQARTLNPKMWLCLGATGHGHHTQPSRRKDVFPQEHLGQAGLAALQPCLRHGEGVGGGSSGSGTRWQPVPSRWPTQHSAAPGSGSWQTTKPGCAHPCQSLADLLPLTPRGCCLLLPSRTGLQFGAGWGADGNQPSPV